MRLSILIFIVFINLIVYVSAILGTYTDGAKLVSIQDEARSLVNCETSNTYTDLDAFEFDPGRVSVGDSACLSLRMFTELRLVQQLHIPINTLSRFIQHAQKGYRNISYHNWEHGFSVLHFTFAVIKQCGNIGDYCLTPLESLALLTAAICHDLDHPGTNSQHQVVTNSSIAWAYQGKGSILERHHIAKTLNLLRDPETNFVAQLSEDDHIEFMQLIEEIILATDLQEHFKVLPAQKAIVYDGFNSTNKEHRRLLRSVIISSADLSATSKDWVAVRRSTKLLNTEFFLQGDGEKEMGIEPGKMMDRNKVNIAEEQANFYSGVVMPLFRVLAKLCPKTEVCAQGVNNNHEHWIKSIPYFKEQSRRGRSQLDILDDTDLNLIPTTSI